MNHELAQTLTTALVQFIDSERPEGTMCCSNTECKSIEEMFEGDKFDIIEAFIQKKLTRLTEFESSLHQIIEGTLSEEVPDGSGGTMSWGVAVSDDEIKKLAPKVLALAKKELLSYADESNPAIEAMADLERTFKCNPDKLPGWLKDELNKAFKKGQESSHEDYLRGYFNGCKDAKEAYKKSEEYHFPIMPTPSSWMELCDGTHCTNPHHDCINCPRKTTVGMFTTPNTASGTSSATLHGNTPVTDGKEHNPSFTD